MTSENPRGMESLIQNVTNITTTEKYGIDRDFLSCYHFNIVHFNLWDISPGWYIFSCVLNAIFSVTATVANLLVLAAIRRTPTLHSPSITLLLSLALSDLGVGLIVPPLFFVQMLGKVTRNKAVFCGAGITVEITANALCIISLLTVTAVSLDRYLALQLHLRYNELVTIKRVVIVIGIIWVIGAFIGSLWLYKPEMVKIKVMTTIVICLLTATFSYFQIYRVVSRHYHNDVILKCALEQVNNSKQVPNMASFKSHALSAFWVYCLIVVCYLPYFCVVVVITLTGLSVAKRFLYEITAILVFINSSLNPLVYCWRLREIRNAVRKTVKLCFQSWQERESWQQENAQNVRENYMLRICKDTSWYQLLVQQTHMVIFLHQWYIFCVWIG